MLKYWKELVEDIRRGTLKEDLEMPTRVRAVLEARLKADPERADELEIEFQKDEEQIIKRIWTNMRLSSCITTGTFTNYARILRERYLSPDTLMYASLFAATEGMIGCNIWPHSLEEPKFLMWLMGIFFEFIPFDHIGEVEPKTLFMDQLKIGESYEVVITTASGLYRHRLGDIVHVIEFHNQCPVVRFKLRSGQLLRVLAEKVTEKDLYKAINSAVKILSDKLNCTTFDFTSCASVDLELYMEDDHDVDAKAPFYIIFLELDIKQGTDQRQLAQDFSLKMDRAPMKGNVTVEYYRQKHSLDQLRCLMVRPGGFERFRTCSPASSSASPGQLKIPRVLKKPELIRFMMSQTSGL